MREQTWAIRDSGIAVGYYWAITAVSCDREFEKSNLFVLLSHLFYLLVWYLFLFKDET